MPERDSLPIHSSRSLQVGSLEEADRKIDGLAGSGQLNPALLLTMAKAYSAAKDTNITKEEVKEIMGHLYFKVRPAPLTQLQHEACTIGLLYACSKLPYSFHMLRVHLMDKCLCCASPSVNMI